MSAPARLSFAMALFFCASSAWAQAQEPEWLQNFTEAKAKAAKDGKDLLVDFTGSDWCVWCKRLDQEVFQEQDFKTAIQKDFVLVKLDFPKDESLVTDEIRQQNTALQEQFAVQGFPTVFLLDSVGRPYAQTGYQKGGAQPYLEHLADLRKAKAGRDEHWAKAKDAKGVERAQHLSAGLDALTAELVLKHYRAEVDEIIALDADNQAGLKDKFAAMIARADVEAKFRELAQEGKWDEVDALMVETLAKYKGHKELEQMATFYRAVVLIESKQDFDGALRGIDAARAIDPDGEMGKRLAQIRKNVERIKAEQEAEKAGGAPDKDKKDGGN